MGWKAPPSTLTSYRTMPDVPSDPVQDSGTSGAITSATFILHRMPKFVRTVCLEFFGQVHDAVPSIVEIKDYLDAHPKAILAGPSHSSSDGPSTARFANTKPR